MTPRPDKSDPLSDAEWAATLEEFEAADTETKTSFIIALGIMEGAKALERGALERESLYDIVISGLTLSRAITLREFFRFTLKKFRPTDAARLIAEGHKISTEEATKAVREFNNLVSGLLGGPKEPKP